MKKLMIVGLLIVAMAVPALASAAVEAGPWPLPRWKLLPET